MKKFITICLMALIVFGGNITTSASGSNINGKIYSVCTGFKCSETMDFDDAKAMTLPQYSTISIVMKGSVLTRVRVLNGKLEGKMVYVHNIHLKTHCVKVC